MDLVQIYACSLGGLMLILLLLRVIKAASRRWEYCPGWLFRLLRPLYRKVIFFLLKHVLYPRFFRSRSRYWFLLQSVYWGGTFTCNFIRASTLPAIASRAGNLAVINFIPLVLSGRLSLAADLLGLPIGSYIRVHGTLAVMTCVQAILHSILRIRERGWSPERPIQFYGLLALSAICFSIALLLIRRIIYEAFIKMHYWLAILSIIAIWRHVRPQRAFAQIYMLAGSIGLASTTVLHWIILAFRNITSRRFGTKAQVYKGRDSQIAQIVIPLNRPFTVHAGMVVYIWMPGVSFLSSFQSHPFTIVWWETNKEGKASSITLLIQQKNGFSKKLVNHEARQFFTLIDGPYGGLQNLAGYENILLVASGVGIVSQISYIRELLGLSPKNIFVAWEVEDESNLDWVYQFMDRLLAQDTGSYILRFGLYMPPSAEELDAPQLWNSNHHRIWKLSGKINPRKVVNADFWKQRGTSLVTGNASCPIMFTKADCSVSGNTRIRTEIKQAVHENMEHVVDLLELPFQPETSKVQRYQKNGPNERV